MINEEYDPRGKVAVVTGVAGPRGIGYASAKRMIFLFALLALLPIMGLFHLLSISMPRSGGDYVYVSRLKGIPD